MELRKFIHQLEQCGELKRVTAAVDPRHEIGAICKVLNEKPNGPAVLFENVKGSAYPVVGQLLATHRRIAMALGLSERTLFEQTAARATQTMEPRLVSSGPCQEVIFTGDEVDLHSLPICINNEEDGGRYITAGHVIMRDPEFGMNMAIYRMMVLSKNEVSIRFSPGHDGYDLFVNAEKRGAKKFELAVAIGVEPAIYIASQFEMRLGVYELGIAGALAEAPIDVVRCKTVDLEVPAVSEIILEGEIDIPGKTAPEGPFGEFCGYTTQVVPNERVMKIKAITHRKDPFYQNIWLGKPPHEHLYVDALTYGVAAYLELKPAFPAVKMVYAPPWGVSIALVIQVDSKFKRAGLVDDLLAASLYTRSGKWKYVIVVDDDVNVYDPNEVLWALTTRFQPARDMFIIPHGSTSRLEPSATPEGVTSKMMADATMKDGFRGRVAEPAGQLRRYVEDRWSEYGL